MTPEQKTELERAARFAAHSLAELMSALAILANARAEVTDSTTALWEVLQPAKMIRRECLGIFSDAADLQLHLEVDEPCLAPTDADRVETEQLLDDQLFRLPVNLGLSPELSIL